MYRLTIRPSPSFPKAGTVTTTSRTLQCPYRLGTLLSAFPIGILRTARPSPAGLLLIVIIVRLHLPPDPYMPTVYVLVLFVFMTTIGWPGLPSVVLCSPLFSGRPRNSCYVRWSLFISRKTSIVVT